MAQLRRQNLSQLVSAELMDRIKSGELRPGDRIPPEPKLMEEFDVSRNVIREAVQQLTALKVVDVRPRRGIIVREQEPGSALDAAVMGALLNDQTVDDLYEFRLVIETAMAEAAAMRATESDLTLIDESLERFRESVGSRTSIFAADVQFHQCVARSSGNVIYDRVLAQLASLLEMYRRETDRVTGAPERALVEHVEIADAIHRKDPKSARLAMQRHIRSAMAAVNAYRSGADDLAPTPNGDLTPSE